MTRAPQKQMAKQLEYSAATSYGVSSRVPSMIPQLVRRPLLVKDEEHSLAVRANNGDEAARRKVIESNMRLVCNIARQYQSQQVPFEDLVQEGAIGLTQAIDRFDADKGYRFSTYAVYWIKQSIRKAVTNRSRVIRLPAHAVEEKKRLARFREEFEAAHGRTPMPEEIAEAFGYTVDKVATLLGAEHDCLSLDSRTGAYDYTALLPDRACEDPEAAVLEKADHDTFREFLGRLSPRERLVIIRRLGLEANSSPEEPLSIARELGISRTAVHQAEANAIRSLRKMVEDADSGRLQPER